MLVYFVYTNSTVRIVVTLRDSFMVCFMYESLSTLPNQEISQDSLIYTNTPSPSTTSKVRNTN